jgi:hypothetical protein
MVALDTEYLRFHAPVPLVARARAAQLRVAPGRPVPRLSAVLRRALAIGLDAIEAAPVDDGAGPQVRS